MVENILGCVEKLRWHLIRFVLYPVRVLHTYSKIKVTFFWLIKNTIRVLNNIQMIQNRNRSIAVNLSTSKYTNTNAQKWFMKKGLNDECRIIHTKPEWRKKKFQRGSFKNACIHNTWILMLEGVVYIWLH